MARNNSIRLYDLVLASGCTISPYVWRTKYAIRHKGLEIDAVPNRQHILGGGTLEEIQAGREARLLVPPALEPLRLLLRDTPWLGGDHPNYADYCILAVFRWCASVAKIPPLHADDTLKDYIDRGFDLYGGLGRHPGMHNLFGLPKAA